MKKLLVIIFFFPVLAIAQKKEDSTATAATAARPAPNMAQPGTITMTLKEWQAVIVAINNIGSEGVTVILDPNIKNNLIGQYSRLISPPAEKPKK